MLWRERAVARMSDGSRGELSASLMTETLRYGHAEGIQALLESCV